MKIIFYIGNSWEDWDGTSLQIKGGGGSEIAAANMAKIFAQQGHEVYLYGQPVNEGVHDGVTYLHHSKYNNINCHVLIASRTPWAVDDIYKIEYEKAILWMHDTQMGELLTFERSIKFNYILALSNWHKNLLVNYYPFINSDKIIITQNGLPNVSYYDQEVIRNPHKAIYSSSPNRGLDIISWNWKYIIQYVPDAELHIYHGFDVLEIAAKGKPEEQKRLEYIKSMINSSPNVFFHGRLKSSKDLAREQLSAGVWTYPNTFAETFCLTAIEAQSAGLFTVTSDLAALKETVGTYGVLISGDPYSKEYQEKLIEETVKALNRKDDDFRLKLQQRGRSFTWNVVAEQWLNLIREL